MNRINALSRFIALKLTEALGWLLMMDLSLERERKPDRLQEHPKPSLLGAFR